MWPGFDSRSRRRLCPFRKRSLPFETVVGISQNGRCHLKRSMPFFSCELHSWSWQLLQAWYRILKWSKMVLCLTIILCCLTLSCNAVVLVNLLQDKFMILRKRILRIWMSSFTGYHGTVPFWKRMWTLPLLMSHTWFWQLPMTAFLSL